MSEPEYPCVECDTRRTYALKEKKVYSHERHEYVVPVAYIDWQDAVIKAEKGKR